MGIHENFIGGSWTEASTAAPNVNPSNTRDIVGEYARGSPRNRSCCCEIVSGCQVDPAVCWRAHTVKGSVGMPRSALSIQRSSMTVSSGAQRMLSRCAAAVHEMTAPSAWKTVWSTIYGTSVRLLPRRDRELVIENRVELVRRRRPVEIGLAVRDASQREHDVLSARIRIERHPLAAGGRDDLIDDVVPPACGGVPGSQKIVSAGILGDGSASSPALISASSNSEPSGFRPANCVPIACSAPAVVVPRWFMRMIWNEVAKSWVVRNPPVENELLHTTCPGRAVRSTRVEHLDVERVVGEEVKRQRHLDVRVTRALTVGGHSG
jgi:hypothetical protein